MSNSGWGEWKQTNRGATVRTNVTGFVQVGGGTEEMQEALYDKGGKRIGKLIEIRIDAADLEAIVGSHGAR